MRPALTAFSWTNHTDQPFISTEGLRWDNEVGDLCRKCPLACSEHPLVRDEKNENKYHKLCTAWFIAAGNGSLQELRELDRGLELDEETQQAEELIEALRSSLQKKQQLNDYQRNVSDPKPTPLIKKPIILGATVIGSDGYRYRQTPSGEPTVEDLVKPGSLVATNYNSGPYRVLRVHKGTVCSCPRDGFELSCKGGHDGPSCHELIAYGIIGGPPETMPGKDGEYRSKNESYLNELVAVGGRILKLYEANSDEVLILEGPPSQDETPEEPPFVAKDLRRLRKAFLFGWKHGGDGHQLYCYRGTYPHSGNQNWGATDDQDEAYRFAAIDECMDFWRGCHSFPEDYEHCIWDGYLQFFEETKAGIRQVLPPTKQPTLF